MHAAKIAMTALMLAPSSALAAPCGGSVPCGCGDTVIDSVVLTGGLSCSGATGLVIGADNVTIDGAGYTITMSNITATGILADERAGAVIEDIGVVFTTPGRGTGVRLRGAQAATVEACTLRGLQTAILTSEGLTTAALNTGLTLVDNDVQNASSAGMHLDAVDSGLVIERNLFDGDDTALHLVDLIGPWSLSATNSLSAVAAGASADAAVWLDATSYVRLDGLDLSGTNGVAVYLEGTTATEITGCDLSGRYRGIDTTTAVNRDLVLTNNDVSRSLEFGMRLDGIDRALVLRDNDFRGSSQGLALEDLVGPWSLDPSNLFTDVGGSDTAEVLRLRNVTDLTIAGLDLSAAPGSPAYQLGRAVRLLGSSGVTLRDNDLSGREHGIFSDGSAAFPRNTGGIIRKNDVSDADLWGMELESWDGTLDLAENDYSSCDNGLRLVDILGPVSFDGSLSTFTSIGGAASNAAVKVVGSSEVILDGFMLGMASSSGIGLEVSSGSQDVLVSQMLACGTDRGIYLSDGDMVTLGALSTPIYLDADLVGISVDGASVGTVIGGALIGGPGIPVVGTVSGTPTAMSDADGDAIPDLCDRCPNDPTNAAVCGSVDLCAGEDTLLDIDGDGFCGDLDCDDTDPTVFPGAPEQCDGLDNNCLFGVDEGAFDDRDGDSCNDCTTSPSADGPDQDADDICDDSDVDRDGDGTGNTTDIGPDDPLVCEDIDVDSCDDCSQGSHDPADDGADSDSDGVCDAIEPSFGPAVVLSSTDIIGWSPGGTGHPSVIYDRVASQFIMIFETQLSASSTSCPSGTWGIGLATSPDGLSWSDSGGPLQAPEAGTDHSCVVAHPTVVQNGSVTTVFFKAEDESGYAGVGRMMIQWNGAGYDVTPPDPTVALPIAADFGYPHAVFDSAAGLYRIALTQPTGMYVTSGPGSTLGALVGPVLTPGFQAGSSGEVFNPAIACDPQGGFVAFIGGRDNTPAPVTVTAQSLGRYHTDDFVNFSAWPGLMLSFDVLGGASDMRHWDALPYNVSDMVLFYDDRDGSGQNQVRIAHTSTWNATTAASIGDKVCSR